MKKILKFEFSRGLKSKGFWISFIVGVAFCVLQQISYNEQFFGAYGHVSSIQAFVGYDAFLVYNSLFITLFPIIAVMPYASSYFNDIKSGYIKNICTVSSRKNYYVSKCLVVFSLAFIVVALPLIINLMLAMTKYPMIIPEKYFFMGISLDSYVFSTLFNTNPGLYIIVYILIDGLFGGLLALLTLCVSEFTESAFIALTFPFAVYMLTSQLLMFGTEGRGNYSLEMLLNPCQFGAGEERNLVIIFLVLVSFISINIVIRIKRKDIL